MLIAMDPMFSSHGCHPMDPMFLSHWPSQGTHPVDPIFPSHVSHPYSIGPPREPILWHMDPHVPIPWIPSHGSHVPILFFVRVAHPV